MCSVGGGVFLGGGGKGGELIREIVRSCRSNLFTKLSHVNYIQTTHMHDA